jgi:hypothetical protein
MGGKPRLNHKVAVSAKEKHKAALSAIAAAKQFQGYLLLHRRTENIGPHSAIPRMGPILPALYRPVFAVPPSGDCADRTIFWKHNLALSAILWFKSQNQKPIQRRIDGTKCRET